MLNHTSARDFHEEKSRQAAALAEGRPFGLVRRGVASNKVRAIAAAAGICLALLAFSGTGAPGGPVSQMDPRPRPIVDVQSVEDSGSQPEKKLGGGPSGPLTME